VTIMSNNPSQSTHVLVQQQQRWIVSIHWIDDEIIFPLGTFDTLDKAFEGMTAHVPELNLSVPAYNIQQDRDECVLNVFDHSGTHLVRMEAEPLDSIPLQFAEPAQ
jgi:hypothetical protein